MKSSISAVLSELIQPLIILYLILTVVEIIIPTFVTNYIDLNIILVAILIIGIPLAFLNAKYLSNNIFNGIPGLSNKYKRKK